MNFNTFWAVLGTNFVTLKATGTVDWSWLWVLAPFWVPLAFFLLVALVMAIFRVFAQKHVESALDEDLFDRIQPFNDN